MNLTPFAATLVGGSGPVGSESQCEWMPRLVKTNLAPAGQPDLRDRTPSRFPHLRTLHAFVLECQYLSLQVVTHEIEFVPVIFFGGLNRHFCRRQSENQPSVAGVYRREP